MLSDALYLLLIGPLETLFEIIYVIAYKFTLNPGLAIIGLSLAMNFLLLPLYNRTDAIQLEAIETEKRLQPYVAHIKKTFHGNEQFMMLQTCYRQNHYKPTDALKGISPLMLEIPFFMAAYHYLSSLNVLTGCSFGPIADLSRPDGMLAVGGLAINVLPILMTIINILSSLIYTRDAPLKTKLQLYGMAALFLILLYGSPSGLVLYWTLNNLFSLVKNIVLKTRNPVLTASAGSSCLSALLLVYLVLQIGNLSSLRIFLILLAAVMLNLPLILGYRKKKQSIPEKQILITRKDYGSMLTAGLVLTALLGCMIPSQLIGSSPEEIAFLSQGVSPYTYAGHVTLLTAGFTMIWMLLFFYLAKPKGKKLMEYAMWAVCIMCIVDYLFFGKHYGNLSGQLIFDRNIVMSRKEAVLNLAVLALAAAGIWILLKKKPEVLRMAGIAAAAAMVGISLFHLSESTELLNSKAEQKAQQHPESLFSLSKTGKNVVILMMDRAVSGYVPYIFEEKPQLSEQFTGFIYYPRTLSFGAHTNFGLPAVFGGYEYTPYALNRRDNILLERKHNEALKMMPILFSQNGFEATVCDPTYAGYNWIPDLSVFDDLPQVNRYITMGNYDQMDLLSEGSLDAMKRNFLFYSLFKCAPVLAHPYVYDEGRYQNISIREDRPAQVTEGLLKAHGMDRDFISSSGVLQVLPNLTEITENGGNTFLMMCNDTAHSPEYLQLPDYVSAPEVDNEPFEKKQPERMSRSGSKLIMKTPVQVSHYHSNMASFLWLGRWLDYLKENDVYDNTRIIIVSDHGYNVRTREELIFGPAEEDDIAFYNPLLMVKDFGAEGELQTDDRQMTNADVPTLAMEHLIADPVNPFTGNPVQKSDTREFPVILSHEYEVEENNGTRYLPSQWALVSGDMFDRNNWKILEESQLP